MENEHKNGYDCLTLGYITTGIKKIVICTYSYGDKKLKDESKIKVSNKYKNFSFEDFFTISIKDLKTDGKIKITDKELSKVIEWINLNKKALIYYWKEGNEIPSSKFMKKLKKI
jgi:hypothetical protein